MSSTARKGTSTSAAIDNKNVVEQPLDFSFMNITELTELESEEPRCLPGKKKLEKNEDEKYNAKCLKLNNNILTELKALHNCVEKILINPTAMTWLDVSFNQLSTIDPILCDFENLQIFYMHGNDVSNISEVDKLKGLQNLKKLTLHGNPIENIKGYRFCVLSSLPNLQSLDMSAVTKSDRASARTWKQTNPTKKKKKKSTED